MSTADKENDWKKFQNQTANFFLQLGCEAEVEARVTGARAEHKIDVWVRFKKFGIETKWVIECKYWNSAVPKEKVLALKSIVEDLGADRGILISAAGFQSGAIKASEKTNIMLTTLEELIDTGQDELITSILYQLETRSIELRYALYELRILEQTSSHTWMSKPVPGTDSGAIMRALGQLAALEFGFERARLQKACFPTKFNDSSQQGIVSETLDEFITAASAVIRGAETVLATNSELVNKQGRRSSE